MNSVVCKYKSTMKIKRNEEREDLAPSEGGNEEGPCDSQIAIPLSSKRVTYSGSDP